MKVLYVRPYYTTENCQVVPREQTKTFPLQRLYQCVDVRIDAANLEQLRDLTAYSIKTLPDKCCERKQQMLLCSLLRGCPQLGLHKKLNGNFRPGHARCRALLRARPHTVLLFNEALR